MLCNEKKIRRQSPLRILIITPLSPSYSTVLHVLSQALKYVVRNIVDEGVSIGKRSFVGI